MMTCRCQRLKLTLQSESPMSGVRSCCPKSTSLSFMPLRRCTSPAYRSHVSAMANYGKYTPYTLYLVPDARCPMPYAQELTFASATVSSRCTRTPHTKYEIQKYLSLSSRWRHTPRGVWRVKSRARWRSWTTTFNTFSFLRLLSIDFIFLIVFSRSEVPGPLPPPRR